MAEIKEFKENFIFEELERLLNNHEDDFVFYINEYFTNDEKINHAENLLRMIEQYQRIIPEIKLKLKNSK